jgi:Domain of Unknown Function (DUF1080)
VGDDRLAKVSRSARSTRHVRRTGAPLVHQAAIPQLRAPGRWRVAERCDNSGVFVRFPTRPRSPADAISGGYEVQIDDCDPRGLSHQTGSIYDHAPAIRLASRAAGRWNRFHIRVVGQHYTVFLNGARVARLDGARAALGYVGLQNHDPGSRVSFRRIRARPLR